MKKIFTLLFFIALGTNGFTQCIPDTTITTPGYSPDSITGLPHAIVGTPYAEDIQVLVPAMYQTYSLDSVVLTSINGLPPGFTYSCTPTNCHLMPLANGCLLISGPALPGSAAGNIYNLDINLTVYVHIGPFSVPTPETVSFYSIVVDQSSGIASLSKSHFDAIQNFPNPFSQKTSIAFSSPGNEIISLKIYNLLGTLLFSRELKSKSGVNFTSLEAKDFIPGIYMYALSNGKATITRRMIVVKSQ